jgi:Lrp/AsnC family leucine-responsive transcriptional regulator
LGCNVTGAKLAQIPEVQEVHSIAGEDCFLVKVRTADSASLIKLMRTSFSEVTSIIATKTTIVLETVKEQQHLIIPKPEQDE